MYLCMSVCLLEKCMRRCMPAQGMHAEIVQNGCNLHVARFERTCTMCTELIFVKDKKDVVQ
jgi:hypothetical protein